MDDAAAKPDARRSASRPRAAPRAPLRSAAVVILLALVAAAGLRRPQPDSGSDLPLLHAGAGAMLEPARGLCRPGLGRPAGLCRARRLSPVRAHASSAASIRCSPSCSPALSPRCCALPTALVVFRLRGAYFAIGTWVVAEVYRLVLRAVQAARRRHRHVAAAVASPTSVPGIEWVKTLFDVRTPAARDIVTYWVALALVAGTLARRLSRSCARAAALRSRAIRDSEAAAAERRRRQSSAPSSAVYVVDRRQHRHDRRADLSAEGAHLAGRRLLGARLDRLCHLHRRHRRHRHHRRADHRRRSSSI